MKLIECIRNSKDVFDFWSKLESAGGRLLFEEYVATYLKATLPGDTYWLGEDVVPPFISERFNFSNILKGKRSLGSDVVNIHNDRAVAYESKWFDEKESIGLKTISDKLQVIRNTGIDQLIFTTNARRSSFVVDEWAEEAGFMFQDEWYREDVYDAVKKYLFNTKKVQHKKLEPRDQFFQEALDDLQADFQDFQNLNPGFIKPVRIFQHWPASSGKGSFPRIAYDKFFRAEYKGKKMPINLVVNPTLVVLKTNLVKLVEHDLAIGNNIVHVIFASDVIKSASTSQELASMRAKAKVFTKKIDFIKFMKTCKKEVWIHTTVHSYTDLASLMKKMKKKFFFGHLDEVHHYVQPDWSTWTDCLDDSVGEIKIRLMSSANIKLTKGTNTIDMEDPAFCDIKVKALGENQAVELGYKRQPKIINYTYRKKSLPFQYIDLLEKGLQPLVKLKSTDQVVPLSWFITADALIRFRIEYGQVQHTKLTLNTIDECVDFGRFVDSVKDELALNYIQSTSDPMFKRIKKLKVKVADTKSNNTVKLLKEISAIPHQFNDSFIIHCYLLGEGWDPENGWIDSNMFVSPTWSEIRIYQDVNRGARIGDGSKKINYIIMATFINDGEESLFNAMFGKIKQVAEVLEIGVEDIREQVTFKDCKPMPKNRKMNRSQGDDDQTYYDELESTFMSDKFDKYIKDGKYYMFGSLVQGIIDDFQKICEDRHLFGFKCNRTDFSDRAFVIKELVMKYMDYFGQFVPAGRIGKCEKITSGEHYLLNDNAIFQISEWRDKMDRESTKRKQILIEKGNELLKKTHDLNEVNSKLEKYYFETFGKPAEWSPADLQPHQVELCSRRSGKTLFKFDFDDPEVIEESKFKIDFSALKVDAEMNEEENLYDIWGNERKNMHFYYFGKEFPQTIGAKGSKSFGKRVRIEVDG